MKKARFVQCPTCHRFLFYGKHKKHIWIKMNEYESIVIRIMKLSKILISMFGEIEISDYECLECQQSKLN